MQRGQKFFVPLDDDDSRQEERTTTRPNIPLPGSFVSDVLERKPTAPAPPDLPTRKNPSGFPQHTRRPAHQSRFKQRQAVTTSQPDTTGTTTDSLDHGLPPRTWEEEERRRIDQENRQKLADMSPDQIAEERRELMESLSPALLQRLLQRSNIDSGSAEVDLSQLPKKDDSKPTATTPRTKPKTVSFADPDAAPDQLLTPDTVDPSPEQQVVDSEHEDADIPTSTIHFPRPSQPPDLDPTSSTFLTDLHTKYFPDLPSDPSKLAWMTPLPNTTLPSPSALLEPSTIRFSFTGALLAPRTAAAIPVTAGLHHHAADPETAGYTISELAHLGHSAFAPQRAIAFQTLGRILFRLGQGEFGDPAEEGEGTVGSEDSFGALARGLWREVEANQVLELLVRESEGKGVDGGRHVSAKAYATEAVWLWRRGGGRRWKAD